MKSMNNATDYLRAALHRAINQGDKSLVISTLDLKDTLAELERLQNHQDFTRPTAPLVGWADPVAILQMRQGKLWRLSISRKRVGARTQQVCASTLQIAAGAQGAKP
ncbi:hypothetical protein ALP45_00248 [Pseudomonas coronafaciens pv. atropurpurea]|nr:Unknown protein sequence [Pseudomonas coronafaciens pv. atropurpurea]RMT61251.1 hypothetical protein ALP45_00248 [Pseudomonas coronafaciens pv. atropurpurea]